MERNILFAQLLLNYTKATLDLFGLLLIDAATFAYIFSKRFISIWSTDTGDILFAIQIFKCNKYSSPKYEQFIILFKAHQKQRHSGWTSFLKFAWCSVCVYLDFIAHMTYIYYYDCASKNSRLPTFKSVTFSFKSSVVICIYFCVAIFHCKQDAYAVLMCLTLKSHCTLYSLTSFSIENKDLCNALLRGGSFHFILVSFRFHFGSCCKFFFIIHSSAFFRSPLPFIHSFEIYNAVHIII